MVATVTKGLEMKPIQPRHIQRVVESLIALEPHVNQFSELLYSRLNELDISTANLFRKYPHQERGIKLLNMMRKAADMVEHRKNFEMLLANLGSQHNDIGVKSRHHKAFLEALMWSLSICLGKQFDAETRAAWESFYEDIQQLMNLHMSQVG